MFEKRKNRQPSHTICFYGLTKMNRWCKSNMTRTVDRLCSLQYAAAYETLRGVFSIYKWLNLIGPNNWDIFVDDIPLRRRLVGFFSRANCHIVPRVVAVVKLTREIRIESIVWWIETQRDSCSEFKITHLLFVFHIICKCINELLRCKHLNLI